MKVIAYLKEQCGWSRGVREVLARCGIEYEEKQIHIPDNFIEMVEKTGQHLQPCVQFDNNILIEFANRFMGPVHYYFRIIQYINGWIPSFVIAYYFIFLQSSSISVCLSSGNKISISSKYKELYSLCFFIVSNRLITYSLGT